jgi:hypothetical protein
VASVGRVTLLLYIRLLPSLFYTPLARFQSARLLPHLTLGHGQGIIIVHWTESYAIQYRHEENKNDIKVQARSRPLVERMMVCATGWMWPVGRGMVAGWWGTWDGVRDGRDNGGWTTVGSGKEARDGW